ncbi:MAG: hypothetical protein M1816_003264 [Peltula sp. TS41687]|nr:MAG: hypothetical protein M1816_003264 [Peltula sp. TS41687]
MLSGILIFNQKGENLIFRAFRNDCRPKLADVFRIQVISNAQVRSPILTLGSTTFSHVRHENIYLVAVTKSNANAALIFEFLYRLVALGRDYFGKFDEEAVKNNFVLVYELLDEILDFGYPQNTETDTLKMYITTEGVKSERTMEDSSRITMQATGALSWRRSDIKYRKNEAFVDVIEDVNLLMSAAGTVLRADVSGQIVMRAYLTGTPECKFGLNDRLLLDGDNLTLPSGNRAGAKATRAAAGSVTLEDCQFHQCVKLGKFDADRIISFVPPDGEFELMRYRATENVNLPFKVHAIVNEVGKTKVEYSIAIKANYGSKLFATNVIVRVPTPLNTAKITERTSQGKAKYEPEHNNIVWKIPRFTGQSEYVLSAEAILTSMTNQKAWSRPPLSLNFSLLMFTSSGLLVRYLKVFEKSNYSSVKWTIKRKGNPLPSSAPSKRMRTGGLDTTANDSFPRFSKGTVRIYLSPESKHQYKLHKAVLERNSSWFNQSFEAWEDMTLEDKGNSIRGNRALDGAKYYYVLERPEGDEDCCLSFAEAIAIMSKPQSSSPAELKHENLTSTLQPGIKALESVVSEYLSGISTDMADPNTILRADASKQKSIENSSPAEHVLEAYNNLFLSYYNISPKLCTDDINAALSQGELLTKIAEEYNSVSTIRAYVGHSLSQYRRELYTSIAKDPPRWLRISIPLQSTAIFTESIIHVVGCWPTWPWPTQRACLSKDIRKFILSKAKKLDEKRRKVNQDLFLNTITIENRAVDLTEGSSNFETWMVVQIFRDWLCGEVNQTRDRLLSHRARHYRLLQAGGDAYLPLDAQVETLPTLFPAFDWDDVATDLKMLKDYATYAVRDICKNNLMIGLDLLSGIQIDSAVGGGDDEIEDEGEGVRLDRDYLTCTEVGMDEFPWLAAGAAGAVAAEAREVP